MIILGVDPGLAHTGWGIVETRGSICRCRAYGCIDTDATTAFHMRLYHIEQQIKDVIETYHPSSFAVEQIFFGQNVSSAISVAHARGAVLSAGASYGLDFCEFTPMQIKQAVVGEGRANKQQVAYMVRKVLSLDHDPKPDHCTDALAAAIAYANMSVHLSKFKQYL